MTSPRWTVLIGEDSCPRRLEQLRTNFAYEAATIQMIPGGGTQVRDRAGVVRFASDEADPDGALRAIAFLRMGIAA